MNNIILPFLITTLAGLSTMIGIIPCYFKEKNKDTIIAFCLAASSGVMISISIFSLIPESIKLMSTNISLIGAFLITFIFITIGIITSSNIDKNVNKYVSNSKLYKLGIISIVALILHNIPEGITTFISTSSNVKLGITLSLAIALHNIPEGIAIAVPIFYSTKSKKRAIIYTAISGFSELFGAVLAYLFLSKYINNFILSLILALTAGIMLHISIYELLPSSLDYKKNKVTVISFIIGFIIMLLCDLIIN